MSNEARENEESHPLPRIAVTPEKIRVLLTEEERKQEGRKPGQPKPPSAAVLPLYTAPPRPASAHAVGRYAIQFDWQDGHSGGIYSWKYLRSICQCRECTFAAEETTGAPN